jgi:hypothetical protein
MFSSVWYSNPVSRVEIKNFTAFYRITVASFNILICYKLASKKGTAFRNVL